MTFTRGQPRSPERDTTGRADISARAVSGPLPKHDHSIAAECAEECPAHDPAAWRCKGCGRQVPMLADTEDWERPVCADCFDGGRHG